MRDTDFSECGFRQTSFSCRGSFQPNSQRKTLTVDQYHPLRALATLVFRSQRPFLGRSDAAVQEALFPLQQPHPIQCTQMRRHASSQRLGSSHCFSCRQQVGGEGCLSCRNPMSSPLAKSRVCPRNRPGWWFIDVPGCPCAASAQAAAAQSTPHRASFNSSTRFLLIQDVYQSKTRMQRT